MIGMPGNLDESSKPLYMQKPRCALSRILRILYRPKTVFTEISESPDYIGPLIIFIVNVLLGVADIYLVYSKIHLEEVEGLNLITLSGIQSFLAFSLIDTFLWESMNLSLYIACFLPFLLLFGGRDKVKSALSVIGYSFLIVSVGKGIFIAAASQLPVLVVPPEPPSPDRVSLIDMWKSSSMTAFWIFEVRIAIRRLMKFVLPGFCAVGVHLSSEIPLIHSLTAASLIILTVILLFGF